MFKSSVRGYRIHLLDQDGGPRYSRRTLTGALSLRVGIETGGGVDDIVVESFGFGVEEVWGATGATGAEAAAFSFRLATSSSFSFCFSCSTVRPCLLTKHEAYKV